MGVLPLQGQRPLGLLAGLLICAGLGWWFLAWALADMSRPFAQLMMPMTAVWTGDNLVAAFIMWTVMMAAMMLPSSMPMILTFAKLDERNPTPGRCVVFTAAYLTLWTVFSVGAVLAQWALQAKGLTSPMMVSVSPWLSAALLVSAGVFQFTPFKQACLRRCRSPMGFLLTEWREGTLGAWRMGLRHGSYCLGCCWALMALLFVAGVMNLLWVGTLAIFVAAEKLLPWGHRLSHAAGVAMVVTGCCVALRVAV